MSNANVFELTQCLKDSLEYCENNPQTELCLYFHTRLASAQQEFHEGLKMTDGHFAHWRNEAGDDRLSWKHLAMELSKTQGRLGKVGAIGYPDQKVKYWNPASLELVVREMIAYLKSRSEQIAFASEQVEKLERQLERCFSETQEATDALRTYSRFVQMRSNAINNATNTIASFRQAMRRDLGKEHPAYKSIRWPFAVATDEAVL
ncbi:MAG: hypothetical protein ACNA8W_01970 [Bradymonadaceae bacterium]